ncbi:TIGR02391 family protein, partial [Streptomyces sp. NPDC052644]
MPINYSWVLTEWKKFLIMTERVKAGEAPPTYTGEVRNVYSFVAPDREVEKQLSLVRVSMERVFNDWQWPYRHRSLVVQVKEMRKEVCASIPLVERSGEIEANLSLDESGPQMAADDLHPWVWNAARPHWESGNHRAAIHAAAMNVNSRMRKKLDRYDVSEAKAVREAFSVE